MPRGVLSADQQEARAQKKVDEIKYKKVLRRLSDTTQDIPLAAALILMLNKRENKSATTTTTTTPSSAPKAASSKKKGKSVTDVISNKIPTISRKGEYDPDTQYFFLIDQDGYFWVAYKPLTVISYNNLSGPYTEVTAKEFINNHCKAINAALSAGMKKREVVQILIQKVSEEFDDKDETLQEIWTHKIT